MTNIVPASDLIHMTRLPDYDVQIPTLDLALRHFERETNGILVIGTWRLDPKAMEMPEPCLVLLHPNRPIAAGRTMPVVIPMSSYADWAPNTADPVWTRRKINEWLTDNLLPGSPNSVRDAVRILTAIEDSLRDLLHIPPRLPPRSRFGVGEATIRNEAGLILGEKELKL